MTLIHKNQRLRAIIITAIITAALIITAVLSAGCITPEPAAEPPAEPPAATPIATVDATPAATATQTPAASPYPDALPRGEYYRYTDDTNQNTIKVTVTEDAGKKLRAFSYSDPSLDKVVTITPADGSIYYCIAVSYTHSGIERINQKIQSITTPAAALHRLHDADGTTYRPLQLNVRRIYSYYGNYYQTTTLERMSPKEENRETYSGWLIYEVPETFAEEGAYLTIHLGKWGTPAWGIGG